MKLSLAAATTLITSHSAQATCDSQITIDVPTGITGLSFVGYDVDPAKIVRSTGSVSSHSVLSVRGLYLSLLQ